MTLATHAVTGALIGAVSANNIAFAALAGFSSHFLFDTIPHWDYPLGSAAEDEHNRLNNTMQIRGKEFFLDLLKTGFDFCLGLTLVALLVANKPNETIIGAFVGALAAIIPDPLQFVYWKLRPRLMEPLQRFHIYMHANTRLNHRPLLGIASQIAIILVSGIALF